MILDSYIILKATYKTSSGDGKDDGNKDDGNKDDGNKDDGNKTPTTGTGDAATDANVNPLMSPSKPMYSPGRSDDSPYSRLRAR